MGIWLGDELGDLGLFAPGFLSGSTCSWQVPLSTEHIQGNVRVFYSLIFLSPIPRDDRELKGLVWRSHGASRSLSALESCSQIKAVPIRGKSCISAPQMLLT